MAFTLTLPSTLARLPTFAELQALAQRHQLTLAGDKHAGTYSGKGVCGQYAGSAGGWRGTFAGSGVHGTLVWQAEKLVVEVAEKPFYLPQSLIESQLRAGFARLCAELGLLPDTAPQAGGGTAAGV